MFYDYFLGLFILYELTRHLSELEDQRYIDGWNASDCVELSPSSQYEGPHKFRYCELIGRIYGFHDECSQSPRRDLFLPPEYHVIIVINSSAPNRQKG